MSSLTYARPHLHINTYTNMPNLDDRVWSTQLDDHNRGYLHKALKSAWNGSCNCLFFSTVTYIRVKRHLKWEGGTWFRPSGIDWIVGSWGVTNKMVADLKCQFADSGGGFLATGFTADTKAWINVLFIRDDDHDQRHKTCLNSAPARERLPEWLSTSSIRLSHIFMKQISLRCPKSNVVIISNIFSVFKGNVLPRDWCQCYKGVIGCPFCTSWYDFRVLMKSL